MVFVWPRCTTVPLANAYLLQMKTLGCQSRHSVGIRRMSWGHQGTIIIITIIILVERQIRGLLLLLLTSSVIDTCLYIDRTGLQASLARMTIM